MARSAPRMTGLEQAATRAPRHSVERLVRLSLVVHELSGCSKMSNTSTAGQSPERRPSSPPQNEKTKCRSTSAEYVNRQHDTDKRRLSRPRTSDQCRTGEARPGLYIACRSDL